MRRAFFDSAETVENLGRRSLRGGAVSMAAHGINMAVQIASTIVLARLLEPEDFGLVAMVIAMTGFATIFVDLGTRDAVAQPFTAFGLTLEPDDVAKLAVFLRPDGELAASLLDQPMYRAALQRDDHDDLIGLLKTWQVALLIILVAVSVVAIYPHIDDGVTPTSSMVSIFAGGHGSR